MNKDVCGVLKNVNDYGTLIIHNKEDNDVKLDENNMETDELSPPIPELSHVLTPDNIPPENVIQSQVMHQMTQSI